VLTEAGKDVMSDQALDVKDTFGRNLRDLRISVTDRCNFRCTYCMPKDIFGVDYPFMPHEQLLSFEEVGRLASIFVRFGVKKIRLTGGEPLLRRELERLVAILRTLPKVELTMTTNGALLERKAQALRAAGLDRVSVSLDSLDDRVFSAMNDIDFPVQRVLAGMDAAEAAGFNPVKVNMVVQRGVNEDSILPMARFFRGRNRILRFIEYMDVGSTNGWRLADVVPAAEILERVNEVFPLEAIKPNYPGEVARRFRYRDGAGEIGVIASVTRPFCGGCTRARLSADGSLFTCLFAIEGMDLKSLLRGGASDEELGAAVSAHWAQRDDRYSDLRSEATPDLPKIEMSYIGG
jgi:cyclic pyranopterin phosphate synthase